jgi:hypothetical protein
VVEGKCDKEQIKNTEEQQTCHRIFGQSTFMGIIRGKGQVKVIRYGLPQKLDLTSTQRNLFGWLGGCLNCTVACKEINFKDIQGQVVRIQLLFLLL